MKILIISHPPVATQNNMGKTLLSLFSEFEKEELCQLYIYPSFPNVDPWSSYYRVTDKDVLRTYMGKRGIGGEVQREVICDKQGLYENEEDRSFYRNRKNKSAFRRLMRDVMWRFSPWYNKKLKEWLERENPDCIFVAPGAAKFLYDMALRIAEDRKIPIVPYICDEYYFVQRPKDFLDRFRLYLLRRKIEALMQKSKHLIVISEELKCEYLNRFGVDTTVLMTGGSAPVQRERKTTNALRQISYFGNIRCNRFVSLKQIGKELESINLEKGTDYRLKIFTAEQDPGILSQLEGIPAVELCGFVSGAEFERAFSEAELLLHTEAFDEKSMDFTRHSISTKIADSLASGIPVLAYGPETISSMKHLIRYDCALLATSREQLRVMLLSAFEEEHAREAVVKRAMSAAKQCHDGKRNSERLRQILSDVTEER